MQRLVHRTEVILTPLAPGAMTQLHSSDYLHCFQEGRNGFENKFGMSSKDLYLHGLAAPIVSLSMKIKRPQRADGRIVVETIYENSTAASIRFDYRIYEFYTGVLLAFGNTRHVFVDAKTCSPYLTTPDLFLRWKEKMHLTS